MPVVKSEEMGKTMSTAEVPEPKEQKKSPFRKLLARLHLCPHSSGKMSLKKPKKKEEWSPPPPLLKTTQEETPVPPLTFNRQEETPVPPPRKHRVRNQDSIESIDAIHVSDSNAQLESPQPVSEPIIIAKKIYEHVCDGEDHHVHNVVNGVVVDKDVIRKGENNKSHVHDLKVSSLSLPSYIDLKKKEEKRRPERASKNKKKSSSSSLPTDKKTKPNSAAERIESFIRRWKSVSSFRPQKNKIKEEKTKRTELESDKNSENSWGGLDDWDVGVIENDIHTYGFDIKQIENQNTSTPESKKEKINKKLNTQDVDRFISYIEKDVTDNRISIMTDISNDTCKDFLEPSEMPELTLPSEKPTPIKQKPKPFTRKRTIDKDIEVTSEFLKHETMNYSAPISAKYLKMAPLATFDSDRDINKLLNIEQVIVKEEEHKQNEKGVSLLHILDDKPNKRNGDLQKQNKAPVKIPRKKTIGHSNLLKFIKETKINPDEINHSNTNAVPDSKEKKLEGKVNENNDDSDTQVEEPEIIPEIRSVENMWQEILQRDDDGKLSSMLELETAISDSLDNSSEDTKSTIVDSSIQCK